MFFSPSFPSADIYIHRDLILFFFLRVPSPTFPLFSPLAVEEDLTLSASSVHSSSIESTVSGEKLGPLEMEA